MINAATELALISLLSPDGSARSRTPAGPSTSTSISTSTSTSKALLCTTYEQCAQDTVRVLTFLGRAAVQHSFPLSRFQRANGNQPCLFKKGLFVGEDDLAFPVQQSKNSKRNAARRKKKAEQGKETASPAAASGAGSDRSPAGQQARHPAQSQPQELPEVHYLVQPRLLPELARHLVARRVEIPTEFWHFLCRCISTRLAIITRYFHVSEPAKYKREFQVDALREMGTILYEKHSGPAVGPPQVARQPVASPATDTPVRSASFDNLLQDFASASSASKPLLPLSAPSCPYDATVSAKNVFFSLPFTEQEAVLLSLTFFSDLHDLRKFISDIWVGYSNGKVALTTAAILTNTILEALRRPHDLLAKHVSSQSRNEFTLVNGPYMHIRAQYSSLACPDAKPIMNVALNGDNPAVQALGEDFFTGTNVCLMMMLMTVGRNNNKDKIIDFDPDSCQDRDIFDDTLRFASLRHSDRLNQTGALLKQSYAAYTVLLSSLDSGGPDERSMFAMDQMARTWHDMLSKHSKDSMRNRPSLHATFCAQIFVDINFKLGPTTYHAYRELKDDARQMTTMIRLLKEVAPDESGGLQHLLEDLDVFAGQRDPIVAMCQNFSERDYKTTGHLHQRMLLQRNPVMAGLSLYKLQIFYQMQGRELMKTHVTATATHLYRACKYLVPSSPWTSASTRASTSTDGHSMSWPDADLLLSHPCTAEFVGSGTGSEGGDSPRTADAAFIMLMKMLHVPDQVTQDLRREDGSAGPLPSSTTTTQAQEQSTNGDDAEFELADMARMKHFFMMKLYWSSPGIDYCALLDEALLATRQGQTQQKAGKAATATQRPRNSAVPTSSPTYTPIQYLTELSQALAQE
ncbi:unnamed protein product [Tilletia laevis]|nr:unnamed protein product [Tilletia laevis]